MGNLYPKWIVIDSLRKYVSGVQFEEKRLTEEEKLLLTLDSFFGPEALNDFIAEYLKRGGSQYSIVPLF